MKGLSVAEKKDFLQILVAMSDKQLDMLNDRIADNRGPSDWKRVVVEAEVRFRDVLGEGERPHFQL